MLSEGCSCALINVLYSQLSLLACWSLKILEEDCLEDHSFWFGLHRINQQFLWEPH